MSGEYYIVNYLVCIFDVYLVCDFVGYLEGVKPYFQKRRRRNTAILLAASAVFIFNLLNSTKINLISSMIINLIFIITVMKGSGVQKVVHFLLVLAIQYGAEFLLSTFFYAEFGEKARIADYTRILSTFVVKLITFVLYVTIKQFLPRKESSIDFKTFVMFMTVPIGSLGIMFTITYLEVDFSDNPFQRIVLIIFYMLVVGGNAMIYYAFRSYAINKKSIQVKNVLIDEKEMQLKYYQQVEGINRKNAEFHHDMCHYLKAIGNLAEGKENERIITLLNELEVEFSNSQKSNFCANSIVNTILNENAERAKEKGIACEVYVEPGFLIGKVQEADIVAILGNLFSNALEAAAKCTNGFINITMYMRNEGRFMIIKMENSYTGRLQKEEGKFQTCKKDKANHGIGIGRIEELTKKYQGSISFECDKQIFRVNLILST